MTRPVVIVVPCFNEEARLDGEAFLDYARGHADVGFLFVDDGSRDRTAARLERLRADLPDAIAVQALAKNAGKAEAVRTGVLAALSGGCECVGYWDADLSTPLVEIARFREILRADPALLAVLGCRIRRLGADVRRQSARHYLGRVFATAASLVLRLPVYDTQCGAKLFRADRRVCEAFAVPFTSRWAFDVEVIARLRAGLEDAAAERLFYEQPLGRWQDVPGSKLGVRHMLAALRDLWRIRRSCRRSFSVVVGRRGNAIH
ncbi:MAG: glycosyltransferase [Myxococcales bacterium]|nr:glycosyltransferase [Myxococcales bacterium]